MSEPDTTHAQGPLAPAEVLGSEAFGAVYQEHSQAIYYLALRYLGDPERAQDVTHDVFLKAWRHLGSYRHEAAWKTWLYRIAINHCRNVVGSWSARNLVSNADEAVWEGAEAPTDSPLRVLEIKELGERIRSTLDHLSEEYRLLLLLVADERLSYEEIGELTGQSADAVRGKLHRARKAFTHHFKASA
ncbi:MAG: sigma-70 family RNA polymerase sigma factor [Verrucomicrobiales bacterium]|nr:sigma-70 family RNA polymerase sigma factor [Verrucomicrobiales bacterium]